MIIQADQLTEFKGDCFAFIAKEMVVKSNGDALSFQDMLFLLSLQPDTDFFVEEETGICTLALDSKEILPEQYKTQTIRYFFSISNEEKTYHAARARALLSWRRDNKFCSKCGSPLTKHTTFTALECPNCKKSYFPRIEPCVIILVNKGEKILLARHVQRNQNVYTCIAGFIEVGETAEHAVRREIEEEVGIKVKNITYKGSQSWPFPDQLMLAFTAEYDSGETKLQEDEISDAQWFDRETCPATPEPGSIAYRLIHNEI